MCIFYGSSWIPSEWIRAHGLEPRALWTSAAFRMDGGSLSAGLCAYAEASVRAAEAATDSAVIFATVCDQIRRGYDAVTGSRPAKTFLFNVPAAWQSPSAAKLFRAELERLGRFLVELGGHAPAAETLIRSMQEVAAARTRLSAAGPGLSARQYALAITRFHADGSVCLPDDAGPPPADAVPVAVIGGPLPESQMHFLDAIESSGARVVLNGTESGERALLPVIRPERPCPDPVETLVRGYLDGCVDVFQRPNTRLYGWLKERIDRRHARGIILWHYVGCDLWRAEAEHLREAFGLPVLLIDADEVESGSARRTGRLEAFVEMLK